MSTTLEPLLKRLHLANARRNWRELVQRAEKEDWTYETLLQTLFDEEVAHRRGTRLARAVRKASFPFLRTIEEFDFSFQSTLRLTTVGSLLAPDFVTEGGSVILEGKPGRGKTHLAVAIAYRALQMASMRSSRPLRISSTTSRRPAAMANCVTRLCAT
jgi:DNA replication protein DnaC